MKEEELFVQSTAAEISTIFCIDLPGGPGGRWRARVHASPLPRDVPSRFKNKIKNNNKKKFKN